MSKPQPEFIRGDVQLNVNGPTDSGEFAIRKFNAPDLGELSVDKDGVLKFPYEMWVRICGPGLPNDGTTICTDESGNLALASMGLQPKRLYVVKYDKPPKVADPHVSAQPAAANHVTITIQGPSAAGIHLKQEFPAPFPGLVGAVTFDGGMLRFANTTCEVKIEVSGLGLDGTKTLTAKPTGISMRSVGMLERDPRENYTVKIFRPQS